MFIYHFNRLIRNRYVWGAFAILISIAFVAVDQYSCSEGAQGPSIGRLNGKPVNAMDFEQVCKDIRGTGRNNESKLPTHIVDRRAWEQIAARQLAKKNGMTPSPEEIRTALREIPAFQGANGFDIKRYYQFIGEQGYTPETFEKHVSNQLALMKDTVLAETASWIPPMVMEDQIQAMTDSFTVRVATISNTFLNADMKLKTEDFQKFYEENKANFALPDRVQVRYFSVPVTNYYDSAAKVTEAEIQDYYDSNISQFKHTTTNKTEETLPLESVRGKITDELRLEAAAYTASTSLNFRIYGNINEPSTNELDKLAGSLKEQIILSPLFSADDGVNGVEDSRKFTDAAFELDPERTDSRYGIVEGRDHVYVVELVKREAAHTPKFEEVLPQVRKGAVDKSRFEAFEKNAKDVRSGLEKMMAAGRTFAEAAKADALNVSTSITYTVNEIVNANFDNSSQIARGAMAVDKGKISDPVFVAQTAKALLIYVEERKPGDALSAQMIRPQIRDGLSRYARYQLAGDWQKWNLEQQKLEPLHPLISEDAKVDENGDLIAEPEAPEAAGTNKTDKAVSE